MELFLFVVSGFHMVYYVILAAFTDAAWMTQMYWPVSAAVFVIVGLLLKADRKRRQGRRRCMSLELRTAICTSCGLYFLVVAFFTIMIFIQAFSVSPVDVDYLIFIENGDVETTLTESDYNALNCTVEYMKEHEDTSVVLAGCSRFRDMEVDESGLQDMMKKYLMDRGIHGDRIITEEISSNLRQNITYSYAYILVDWYGEDAERSFEPMVGVVAESVSVWRYRTIIGSLGNVSRHMEIISYREPVLTWPARIMEEICLIIRYHLINQFEYNPS